MSNEDKKDIIIDIETVPAERNAELEAQIQPLHNNVFCMLDSRLEQTSGGIIIPEAAQEKRQEATVIAVGPGRFTLDGSIVPLSVYVGDRVLLGKYGGTEESIHGVKYSVVKDTDILCVIKEIEEEEVKA